MALDAAKFAGGYGSPFGIDKAKVARELRDIAAKIEAGEILVESASIHGIADHTEFTKTHLRLRLHEKRYA